MKSFLSFLFMLMALQLCNAQNIRIVEQGQPCSIRGLSVVNDRVAWVSGSKGHVALSVDGGQTWRWQQVKGFEQSDFRDVEAFSAREAVIMSSGTPALVLKTIDGGTSWKVCYRNDDKAYFLDAMDFVTDNKHGYIVGDPIDGHFLIMETKDGGETWNILASLPPALPNEAAFAASGTCLQLIDGAPAIITGGSTARFHIYASAQQKWTAHNLVLAQGKSSQGGFSFARGKDRIILVGGDYAQPNKPDSIACYLAVGKKEPELFQAQPSGYQSCVIALGNNVYLSTGTPGTHFSADNGKNWNIIDDTSFNVCQKAKRGNLILLAGDKGKIGKFKNQ